VAEHASEAEHDGGADDMHDSRPDVPRDGGAAELPAAMHEDERYAQGRQVILRVWGEEEGAAILERWRALSPDLERQIVTAMFGDLWSRPAPAPDLKTRSIVHVATLTALHRPNQLRVHVVGALNNGASEREIVETILQVGLLAGFPTSWDALAVCNEVFAERRASGSS
jgi:4-carboxymuconolactone decarboxylase